MAVNTQGFGIQLATGGFSLEANTIFSSYALALAYAKSSAAYEGKVISVTSGAEKGAYIVEAIGENASLKKVGSDVDLSNYVTKDQLTNVYTYKGSKDNYSDLPNNDSEVKPVAGDVWNVVNEYTSTVDGKYYPAGTNWVWNGSEWDAQGGSIDLSGYATVEALNAVSEAATNGIAGVASDLQVTNAEVAKKVTAQDGYSLISEEKLALIDTNAAEIQALEDKNLDNRVLALEGMFKDGETNIDLSQITSTLSEHTTKIGTLETSKADKSVVNELTTTVNNQGERLAAAESANAQQTTDISNLSTKVSGLETTHGNAISGLTTTVEGHTTEIANIKSSISGLAVKSVKAEEKVLAADASGALSTTIALDYDSESKKIQLKGIGNAVVSELDASEFIKDGMINSVAYDAATKKMTITWNTDAGKEATEIDMTGLVDTYTADNKGLVVENNQFSVKLDASSNNRLTVSDSGLLVDLSEDIAVLESTMDSKIEAAFEWELVK